MTTEDLIADVQKQLAHHKHHSFFERDWKVADNLKALLDALEAQAREIAELKNDVFSYKVAWETVCDGAKDVVSDLEKARTELDTLRAELAAIRATDKDAGLVAALKDAATSLETISRLAGRTHYVGDDGERVETYMGHHDQVRGYATSRASVARDALSKFGGV